MNRVSVTLVKDGRRDLGTYPVRRVPAEGELLYLDVADRPGGAQITGGYRVLEVVTRLTSHADPDRPVELLVYPGEQRP